MDIKELEKTLTKNIETALADGWTLKRGSFGKELTKECCAVTANGFMSFECCVIDRERELNLKRGAAWAVIYGFDAAPPSAVDPQVKEYFQLGERLAAKYLK